MAERETLETRSVNVGIERYRGSLYLSMHLGTAGEDKEYTLGISGATLLVFGNGQSVRCNVAPLFEAMVDMAEAATED